MNEDQAFLEELRRQEEDIQFTSFTNETALSVGLALLREASKRSKPVAIDITRGGQQLFHFAMARDLHRQRRVDQAQEPGGQPLRTQLVLHGHVLTERGPDDGREVLAPIV